MFRFQIGDMVIYKAAAFECERTPGRVPNVSRITERISQECCGGTQLYYSFMVEGEQRRAPEGDLLLANDYDWAGGLQRHLGESLKRIAAERKARGSVGED